MDRTRIAQPAPFVDVWLTGEQVAQLPLPPGGYEIHREVHPTGGRPVKVPEVDTLRVPVRWLYPGGADRRRWSYRNADD